MVYITFPKKLYYIETGISLLIKIRQFDIAACWYHNTINPTQAILVNYWDIDNKFFYKTLKAAKANRIVILMNQKVQIENKIAELKGEV